MDVKPKSRWRISKWLVLILIGFLSFHAYHRYLFEKRTALVKRLRDAGATVRYTWFVPGSMPDFLRPHLPFIDLPVKPRVFDIDANNIKLSDETLRDLELMTYLSFVNLENCNVSDVTLDRLQDLESLKKLNLKGTHITNQGLRHLENKPYLFSINLEQTEVTPEAVNRLRTKLNQLKVNPPSDKQRHKKLVIAVSNKQTLQKQTHSPPGKSD